MKPSITVYARNEQSKEFPQYKETRLYKDKEATQIFAILPMQTIPKNTKVQTINCWKYAIEWI